MNYPRVVELDNPKLKTLLVDKGELINEGRKVSEDVENRERELEAIETELKAQEDKVDLSSLKEEMTTVTDEFNAVVSKMDALKTRIYEKIKSETPQELRDKYDAVKKVKEDLETLRRKIALKVQKKNDTIIPLARKTMQPYLQDDFEDYNGLEIRDGKVIGTIFSHMEDFKQRHYEKKK